MRPYQNLSYCQHCFLNETLSKVKDGHSCLNVVKFAFSFYNAPMNPTLSCTFICCKYTILNPQVLMFHYNSFISSGKRFPQTQMRRPGLQSWLYFTPKVFCQVKVRSLCRPVKFFHIKLAYLCLCGPSFVHWCTFMYEELAA